MKWHERHGYAEDPFSTKKGTFIEKSVNLKESAEELSYHIEAGNMALVEGGKGTGKTALLFSVIEQFRGERKIIYYDCGNDSVDVKKLMQNKYGLFGKLMNITPKGMVLMLDNFAKLDKKDIERVKYYFDNNYIRSAVFTGNAPPLPENIMDRIGGNVIKLKQLSAKDAVQLVKNRLGSLDFLPEKIIRKIYLKSGKDVKKFLENCGKACEAAEEAGAKSVSEEHLAVLGEKNE